MVKLGFIKDVSSCSVEYPRVAFMPAKGAMTTTVSSWPDENGLQVFELTLEVPPGVEHLAQWAGAMARILTDMGWKQWALNTDSLSKVLNRYITEALNLWGQEFWPHFDQDGVILIQVGLQREAVAQSVAFWEERNRNVRLAKEYDFDAMENMPEQQPRKRSMLSFLRPRPQDSKHRAP